MLKSSLIIFIVILSSFLIVAVVLVNKYTQGSFVPNLLAPASPTPSPTFYTFGASQPILFNDGSLQYTFSLSKIETVEKKERATGSYIELTLRPRVGEGFSQRTNTIKLPVNLRSQKQNETLGLAPKDGLLPTDLLNKIGYEISITVIYKHGNQPYNENGIREWKVTALYEPGGFDIKKFYGR